MDSAQQNSAPCLDITQLDAWRQLEQHAQEMKQVHMRDLFTQNPQRFQEFFLAAAGIQLDYSKNLLNQKTLNLLLDLARQAQLPEAIEAMFRGEAINSSEQRPAPHVDLRNMSHRPMLVNGVDVMPEVRATLAQMEHFTWRIRSTQWRGLSTRPFNDIVSIGIGGSLLVPNLVSASFRPYWTNFINCPYLANIL